MKKNRLWFCFLKKNKDFTQTLIGPELLLQSFSISSLKDNLHNAKHNKSLLHKLRTCQKHSL